MNDIERIKDIVLKAEKLGWFQSNPKGYPLMQLSEVEKCLHAIINKSEMKRINEWVKVAEQRKKLSLLGDGVRKNQNKKEIKT